MHFLSKCFMLAIMHCSLKEVDYAKQWTCFKKEKVKEKEKEGESMMSLCMVI